MDGFLDLMVRMRGLEPPRCHHHRLLRPARLPVPPHPQNAGEVIMRMHLEGVKNAYRRVVSYFLCVSLRSSAPLRLSALRPLYRRSAEERRDSQRRDSRIRHNLPPVTPGSISIEITIA